jgi:hypothetical protein
MTKQIACLKTPNQIGIRKNIAAIEAVLRKEQEETKDGWASEVYPISNNFWSCRLDNTVKLGAPKILVPKWSTPDCPRATALAGSSEREVSTYIFDKMAKKYGTREYRIGGEWTRSINAKPDECRLTYSFKAFQEGERLLAAWSMIETLSVDKPVRKDDIVDRLTSRFYYGTDVPNKIPICFFVPWGTRTLGKMGPESMVLDTLSDLSAALSDLDMPNRVMLMPADLYATEVNGLPKGIVQDYISMLTPLAEKRGIMVKPWSKIRKENKEMYCELAREITDPKIDELVSNGKRARLIEAASRWSNGGNSREAAYRYMRERICEARIVEEKYKPIKLSAVTVEKDDVMDQQLPRIYIIPEEERFPWLK